MKTKAIELSLLGKKEKKRKSDEIGVIRMSQSHTHTHKEEWIHSHFVFKVRKK